jgi:hypothetical protein
MKYSVLFAASAALALGACSETESAATDATAEAIEAAAAPAGAPAFTAGEAPSKEFMVGTWGEGDACELPINFQADGTIKDGPFDTWELQDGLLTMGGEIKLTLKVVDDKTMESLPEGSTEPTIIKRCG